MTTKSPALPHDQVRIYQELARIQQLRADALATPISDEWDEMDMATYLRHLDETEKQLTQNGKTC